MLEKLNDFESSSSEGHCRYLMTCRFLDSLDSSSHIHFSISTKFCCRHANTENMQPLVTFITIKHLVVTASEFNYFKRLIYWRCLIAAISQFNVI